MSAPTGDAGRRLLAYAMLGAGANQCGCGHLRMEHDERGCRSGWTDVTKPCKCSGFSDVVA